MSSIAIHTNGLTRRFGALAAVSDLELSVPQGAVYGFLGPNGAGKTTTIRMLLGLIRPTAGEVRLFDAPLAAGRGAALRRVGALVETPSLYPHLTGRENLEITRCLLRVSRQRVERSLAMVGMEQDADRRVEEYSQGMKQRLGLALALLGEADLLILDEPTNGLDPAGIHEMRELMRRLPTEYGMTVFLSSHLLNEVEQVATHIGIIQQGRLLFQGPLRDLQGRLHEHVSLGVAGRGDECRALAERVLSAAGWRVLPNNNGHITVAANGAADAALMNAQLLQAGFNVYHLSLEQPSLEDIFLKLTSGPEAGSFGLTRSVVRPGQGARPQDDRGEAWERSGRDPSA
jgi:ABC-type multidrug transport system ATPase subunit